MRISESSGHSKYLCSHQPLSPPSASLSQLFASAVLQVRLAPLGAAGLRLSLLCAVGWENVFERESDQTFGLPAEYYEEMCLDCSSQSTYSYNQAIDLAVNSRDTSGDFG